MNTKEHILDLYYNHHLKQNEIAKIVGKSCPYVSKVVKTDKRNKQEKETRKKTNAENRKVYLQEYFKTYDRPKSINMNIKVSTQKCKNRYVYSY